METAHALGIGGPSARTSRSASARSPSTRWRWRAPTRPWRTGADVSTARSSGTGRASWNRSSGSAPAAWRTTRRSRRVSSTTGRRRSSPASSRTSSSSGPSRRARPGHSVAGKTGTTDNYGDAWFVGYSPSSSSPSGSATTRTGCGFMRTEFGGEPVTGGTLPAQIWKRFMESVDEDEDESFPSPPYLGRARAGWSSARASGSSTAATAARPGSSSTSLATRRGGDRRLQAQRGLGPARRRHLDGGGDRRARRPTARRDRVRARRSRTPQHRREPGAAAQRPRRATTSSCGSRRRNTASSRTSSGRASRTSAESSAAEAPRAGVGGAEPDRDGRRPAPRPGSPSDLARRCGSSWTGSGT